VRGPRRLEAKQKKKTIGNQPERPCCCLLSHPHQNPALLGTSVVAAAADPEGAMTEMEGRSAGQAAHASESSTREGDASALHLCEGGRCGGAAPA